MNHNVVNSAKKQFIIQHLIVKSHSIEYNGSELKLTYYG